MILAEYSLELMLFLEQICQYKFCIRGFILNSFDWFAAFHLELLQAMLFFAV